MRSAGIGYWKNVRDQIATAIIMGRPLFSASTAILLRLERLVNLIAQNRVLQPIQRSFGLVGLQKPQPSHRRPTSAHFRNMPRYGCTMSDNIVFNWLDTTGFDNTR